MSFTFNTHLEEIPKVDINQDFLILGPVKRDTAVRWKNFQNCRHKGTFQELPEAKLIVRLMTVQFLNYVIHFY